MLDYYEVKTRRRGLLFFHTSVLYTTNYSNQISMFMFAKELRKYEIYKNGRLVLIHPFAPKFITNMEQMDKFERYLNEWKSSREIGDPTN